jgi:hypothetical protein
LHLSLSAKSSFYLPAFEISRQCRTASDSVLFCQFTNGGQPTLLLLNYICVFCVPVKFVNLSKTVAYSRCGSYLLVYYRCNVIPPVSSGSVVYLISETSTRLFLLVNLKNALILTMVVSRREYPAAECWSLHGLGKETRHPEIMALGPGAMASWPRQTINHFYLLTCVLLYM